MKINLSTEKMLISRSKARRILDRVAGEKEAIFDFEGVDYIFPSAADEIFRVFQNQNPEIKISAINTNRAVQQMINRAIASNNDK